MYYLLTFLCIITTITPYSINHVMTTPQSTVQQFFKSEDIFINHQHLAEVAIVFTDPWKYHMHIPDVLTHEIAHVDTSDLTHKVEQLFFYQPQLMEALKDHAFPKEMGYLIMQLTIWNLLLQQQNPRSDQPQLVFTDYSSLPMNELLSKALAYADTMLVFNKELQLDQSKAQTGLHNNQQIRGPYILTDSPHDTKLNNASSTANIVLLNDMYEPITTFVPHQPFYIMSPSLKTHDITLHFDRIFQRYDVIFDETFKYVTIHPREHLQSLDASITFSFPEIYGTLHFQITETHGIPCQKGTYIIADNNNNIIVEGEVNASGSAEVTLAAHRSYTLKVRSNDPMIEAYKYLDPIHLRGNELTTIPTIIMQRVVGTFLVDIAPELIDSIEHIELYHKTATLKKHIQTYPMSKDLPLRISNLPVGQYVIKPILRAQAPFKQLTLAEISVHNEQLQYKVNITPDHTYVLPQTGGNASHLIALIICLSISSVSYLMLLHHKKNLVN